MGLPGSFSTHFDNTIADIPPSLPPSPISILFSSFLIIFCPFGVQRCIEVEIFYGHNTDTCSTVNAVSTCHLTSAIPQDLFPFMYCILACQKKQKTAKSDNLNSNSNKSFLHNTSLHIVEEKVFFFWKFILEIRNKQEKMTTFFAQFVSIIYSILLYIRQPINL